MHRRPTSVLLALCLGDLLVFGCDLTSTRRYYCPRFDYCTLLAQMPDAPFACLYDGETGTFCAQPDDRCASGYRWYRFSRPELANLCVEPNLTPMDGGTADAADNASRYDSQ
jgi:hypothetical protein